MAAKTRQLSPEELRGFLDSRARTTQFNNYQQGVRANHDAIRSGAVSGGGGGGQAGGGGSDFDNMLHVGGRALDILGALGYGTNRALSDTLKPLEDAVEQSNRGEKVDLGGTASAFFGKLFGPDKAPSFFKGVGDAITGNQEDLVHGFDLIERTTDVIGNADKRHTGYKDVQDNVNPVAKGVGGFALDVLGDPTVALPAGPGIKAAGGALSASVKAARAAEGGDLLKTAAFFNPVTAGRGAVAGVKDWGQGVKSTIQGLRRDVPTSPVVEEALQGLATRAAPTAGAAAKKAPATASRGTNPEEVALPPAEVRVQSGVAEGARAAEATTEAAQQGAAKSDWDKYWEAVDSKAGASPAAKIIDDTPTITPTAAPAASGRGVETSAPAPAPGVQLRQGQEMPVAQAAERFPDGSKVKFYGLRGVWEIKHGADGSLSGVPAGGGARRALTEAEIRQEGAVSRVAGAQSITEQAQEAASKVSEKSIRTQQAADLAPDIARAADSSNNTLGVLANLRGLTYTTSRYPARIQREVEKLAPMTDRKQVKAWTEAVAELVGEDNAKILRKITDPEEFAAKAQEMARERITNTMAGRTPDDLFRKLTSRNNTFDPAKGREIANLLGLKSIPAADANWKTVQDFLRRSDPKVVFDEMRRQEKISRGLLGDTNIPGAYIAGEQAKNIDPEGVKVAAGEAADDLITPQIRQEYDDAIAGVFPASFEKDFPFQLANKRGENFHLERSSKGEFGPGVKAVSSHVFNQNHQLTLWKNLFEQAGKKFKGETGPARQQLLYEYLMDGLRYTDLRLRSLGIVPVSKAFGSETKLLKNTEDAAFLSFGDVLDAMPPETVKALLLAGKDINVPITLLSDTARYALKLAETEMDSVAQARSILDVLQQRLMKEFAAGSKADTTKWLRSPKNAAILKAVAGAFTDPGTVQRLADANVRNLAFATAVNGKQAWRALKPIVETLRSFTLDPNVSAGKTIDAVLEAKAAADAMVAKTGLKDTPAGEFAEKMLDLETAKAVPSATVAQARNALQQERAVVDASGSAITAGAKDARKAKATAAAAEANAPGKPLTKPKAGAKTETAKKADTKTKEKANTARANEHTSALPTVDDIIAAAKKDAETVIDDPVMDYDAARAAFSMDLPGWLRLAYKGVEKMDGWFGKSDVKPFAISAEMNSQNMMHRYTTALNTVMKGHQPDAIKGAIALFKGMDGNAGLDAALVGAPQGVADAARSLWPTFSVVFDHSEHNLMQRIGMEGAYLNEYLRRQGVPDNYMLGGTQSWENGSAWTQWNWDAVENPLAILDNYHRAITKAQVVPDVAANFSAAFGNKSTQHGAAISAEAARAAGWVKVAPAGGRTFGLFHFVDKEQYYPKEMLTQLAMMDDYFSASRTLDENAIFDQFFRYADPVVNSVKASITLWRPGHHVTNIMGEFLMNTLAGVKNPLRYADAYKVMAAAGKTDGASMDALEKYLRAAAPDGVTLKAAEEGIPVTIRGEKVYISHEQAYQLFDQHGAIIHHNQAEDLINEGSATVGRTPRQPVGPENPTLKALHKINRLAAPGWLGRFSAGRDNVFRIAHASDILQKGNFRSLEEAMAQVTKEINSFHPNMLTLGAAEQKYVRRFIYFYTWQRQAITRVAMSLIDTPGRIMMAPKALYNTSAALGADPDSFGDVVPDEGGIPDYLRGNIGQWMFHRSLTGDDVEGQQNYLWGQSLNAPQLDILQSVLGSVAIDQDRPAYEQGGDVLWQLTSKNLLQNMTPLFRVPAELATHAQVGTGIPIQEGDEGQYLLDQTGLRGPLLFGGVTPGDKNDDPSIVDMKRDNALFNWATGMRRTIYNGPEQHQIWLRQQQEKARKEAEQ